MWLEVGSFIQQKISLRKYFVSEHVRTALKEDGLPARRYEWEDVEGLEGHPPFFLTAEFAFDPIAVNEGGFGVGGNAGFLS